MPIVQVTEAEQLIQWLDGKIDGVEIKSNERTRLAAGCFDLALEHHRAIVLPISGGIYGSAFSLVRLLFEAYVRGVWLHHCASDTELERFKSDKLHRTFESIVRDVETVDGFDEGVLSDVKRQSWKAMNSFTHGGFAQIVRRIAESTIEPNYKDEDVAEALGFANAMALVTAVAIALLASHEQLANEIVEKAKAFWNTERLRAHAPDCMPAACAHRHAAGDGRRLGLPVDSP